MSTRVGMGAGKPGEDTRTDSAVKKENAALKKENAELKAANEKLAAESEAQLEQIGELTARLAELETPKE